MPLTIMALNGKKVKRIVLLLVLLATHFLFVYVYDTQISQSYAKYGFKVKTLGLLEYIELLLFYLTPAMFLLIHIPRPSDVCLWLLYLLSYAPAIFMASFILESGLQGVLRFDVYLVVALVVISIARTHSVSLRMPVVLGGRTYFDVLFISISVATCLYLFSLMHYSLSLDIGTLHERRMETREEGSILAGYIISQARSVIYVLGIYLFVVKKRLIWLLLVLSLSVIGFSYDGTKTSILLPIGLIMLGVVFTRSRTAIWLVILPCMVMAAAALEIMLASTHIITEYFVRRMYAVTGLISTAYFDFFNNNPMVLMSDSVGKYFIPPVYEMKTAYIIGSEYFGDPEINANTNIWWGGYANFGFSGILLASILAGFILGLIDNIARSGYFVFGCIMCAYIGFKWNEQFIHTSLLSGGILALITLAFIAVNSNELRDKWGRYY